MNKSGLHFSLASLLLTVAVIAGVLALMFQVPTEPARLTFIVAVVVLSALGITGVMYGQPAMRTFWIGALGPLAMMFIFVMTTLSETVKSFRMQLHHFHEPIYTGFFGLGILASIAIGSLCVAFRWLIVRREPPEV